MGNNLEQAWLFIQLAQYSQAEKELRQELILEPNNTVARLLLCQSLLEQNRYQEAGQEAEFLIFLAPNWPHAYYAKACNAYNVYLFYQQKKSNLEHLNIAEKAIKRAIELSDDNLDYWILLAGILFEQGNYYHQQILQPLSNFLTRKKRDYECWLKSLQAAQKGLEIDPDQFELIHLQALIFSKLKLKEQAKSTLVRHTLQMTLSNEQQNPSTHIYLGHLLLEEGKFQQALEHFQLAFKLTSEPEVARLGIIESLKQKYPIYRLLSPTTKQGKLIWIGFLGILLLGIIDFLINSLRASIGKYVINEAINHDILIIPPWLVLFSLFYTLFVLTLPWLFNLSLKENYFAGKFLGIKETVMAYFWVAAILVISLTITAVNTYPLGARESPLLIFIVSSSTLIPFVVCQANLSKKIKFWMTKYTVLIIILAIIGLFLYTNLENFAGITGITIASISFLCCGVSTIGAFLSYYIALKLAATKSVIRG